MRELTILFFATGLLSFGADSKSTSHPPVTTRNWTYRGTASTPPPEKANFQKTAEKREKPPASAAKKETPPPPAPEPERRFLTRLVFR